MAMSATHCWHASANERHAVGGQARSFHWTDILPVVAELSIRRRLSVPQCLNKAALAAGVHCGCFCAAQLAGSCARTACVHWQQSHTPDCTPSKQQVRQQKRQGHSSWYLHTQVWSHKSWAADDFMGQAELALAELAQLGAGARCSARLPLYVAGKRGVCKEGPTGSMGEVLLKLWLSKEGANQRLSLGGRPPYYCTCSMACYLPLEKPWQPLHTVCAVKQ
jgi:hypothetical protein